MRLIIIFIVLFSGAGIAHCQFAKETLYFDFDKSIPQSDLQKVEDLIRSTKSDKLSLIGHTDSLGSKDYNYSLGLRRAKEVRRLLLKSFPDLQIEVESKGEEDPIASNGTDAGRQLNRRVELTFLGKEVIKNDQVMSSEPEKKEEKSQLIEEKKAVVKKDQKKVKSFEDKENEKLQPKKTKVPFDGCRVHFSGLLMDEESVYSWSSTIFEQDKWSEYVGSGYYPSCKVAFPNASASTFDGIAVDEGTRLIIFSDLNFKGDTLLDVTGPALINNKRFRTRRKKLHKEKFEDKELQRRFPQEVRYWSETNMNDWQHGSLIIRCPSEEN